MNFQTAQEAAKRMGVTVRAVQKWAKEGKLPGAHKAGRDWMIPDDTVKPGTFTPDEKAEDLGMLMPLLNCDYPIGQAEEFIRSIADEDERNIALGEYCYFTGDAEQASRLAEPYLTSENAHLRFSAIFLYTFSNLSRGHLHLSQMAIDRMWEELDRDFNVDKDSPLYAMGVFTASTVSVLLHLEEKQIPPLENYLRRLPAGIKLFALYIIAHKAYLAKDYARAYGIAEAALLVVPTVYPVAAVYIHLIAAVSLINLMQVEQAREHVAKAWALAEADGLIEPFGEHHGLLQGLIESYFKKEHPEALASILEVTRKFSTGWRKTHNKITSRTVAHHLTTTEFTIAMLCSRNWRIKEIADHMELSERTIKNYLQVIYEKLCVSGRRDLEQYMLK